MALRGRPVSLPVYPDQGLRLAIKAAGGARSLAKALGVSRQSVERWHRIPADRITDIERVTGVDRTILRPDLYERPE